MHHDEIVTQLGPDDTLHFVHRRRLDHGWGESSDGTRAFFIYHGDKEIEFDDPRDFRFAETLVNHNRFRARDVAGWADEGDAAWDRLRGYLEVLLDQGILARGEPLDDAPSGSAVVHTPALEYRSTPATWSAIDDACVQLAQELTGTDFAIEHIESVIAVNDLARPALDETGRQVGEANVDGRLRIATPTAWATCKYAGSRFGHACPMNVTALRKVNRDWTDVLATLAELRARFTAAIGHAPGQRLTIGEAHMFAMLALSWSGYLMVRACRPVANGALPSVVSSVFMLTDGIRMTTAHMLHGGDRLHAWDDVFEPEAFVRYTDREQLFISARGVCAGPPAKMIEFVTAVLDGGGDAGDSRLSTCTDDVGEFFGYAARAIRATMVGRMLIWETRRRGAGLERWLAALGPEHALAELLGPALRPTVVDPMIRPWSPVRSRAGVAASIRGHAEAARISAIEHAPSLAELDAVGDAALALEIDDALAAASLVWAAVPGELRAPACELLAGHLALCRAAGLHLTNLQRGINRVLGRAAAEVTIDSTILRGFFAMAGRPYDPLQAVQTALGASQMQQRDTCPHRQRAGCPRPGHVSSRYIGAAHLEKEPR